MSGIFPSVPAWPLTTGNERFPIDTLNAGGRWPQTGYVTWAQICQAVATAAGGSVNAFPAAQTPLGSGAFTDGFPALDPTTFSGNELLIVDMVRAAGRPPETVAVRWSDFIAALVDQFPPPSDGFIITDDGLYVTIGSGPDRIYLG